MIQIEEVSKFVDALPVVTHRLLPQIFSVI